MIAASKRWKRSGVGFQTSRTRYDISVDGGFSTESDCTQSCETCRVELECTLTDHGVDEEIAALTGECAPTLGDGRGWEDLDDAITNLSPKDPRWRQIARVVDAAERSQQGVCA